VEVAHVPLSTTSACCFTHTEKKENGGLNRKQKRNSFFFKSNVVFFPKDLQTLFLHMTIGLAGCFLVSTHYYCYQHILIFYLFNEIWKTFGREILPKNMYL